MKNGLIFGALAGIFYLIWVIIGGKFFPYLIYGSIPMITISSLVVIAFMVFACQKEKAALDGFIRFGEGFLVCITVYAVFNLIYVIGFKIYMDSSPTAMANFLEITKTSTQDLLTKMGASEDQIFQSIEEFEENLSEMFTWKTTLLNFGVGIIFPGALLALITAGISSKFSKKTTI